MQCTRKVTSDIYWVGASRRQLALFENVYPIPRGVSYNSYLVIDEQTLLFDTIDQSVSQQFYANISFALGERALDYLVVSHMEPDHCANIADIVSRYPDVKIVGNAKTMQMIKQFFDFDIDSRSVIVKEGDTLSTGTHTFTFLMAPMVHWPEAMVTYDAKDHILFSADAFGTFGALNGTIFNDEINFDRDWLDDFRRYYTNIVGKYGAQVQALLKKTMPLDISVVCPLHGPIWRSDLDYILEKYNLWSTYTPEDHNVMIVYASMYGNTENAVGALASNLAEAGLKNIRMYDLSNAESSELVSEAFRHSHIVLACPTYNGGIFPQMEHFLSDLRAHGLKNRTFALLENGTWAPTAGKQILAFLETMPGNKLLEQNISIKSTLKETQYCQIEELAKSIVESLS